MVTQEAFASLLIRQYASTQLRISDSHIWDHRSWGKNRTEGLKILQAYMMHDRYSYIMVLSVSHREVPLLVYLLN